MNDMQMNSRSLRQRYFPLIWALLYPIRLYLCHFPIQRGKGLVLRHLVMPLLPPKGADYELPMVTGGVIRLQYRETLGWSSLLYGPFELTELFFASHYLRPGDIAFDVGANVGLFSITFGQKVGKGGSVLAFEPFPANAERLNANLALNGLNQVQVQTIALGNAEGELALHLAVDDAYHSFGPVERTFRSVHDLVVRVRTLDEVWRELGRPRVAFIKIDVEGAEETVLEGGVEFFVDCLPTVLIEANTEEHLSRIKARLAPLGYSCLHPASFVKHNFVFHVADAKDRITNALN